MYPGVGTVVLIRPAQTFYERINHDLTFNPSERIIIMYGPNGIGKTMILRIIDTLFNHPLRSLGRMPFEELRLNFDDGSRLTVKCIPGESSPQLVFVSSEQQQDTFTPSPQITPQELNCPLSTIEELLPLTQLATSEWRDDRTGEILGLDEVLNTYGDEFPVEAAKPERSIPPWLEEIKASLPVRLIDTERLTDFSSYGRRRRYRRPYRHGHWAHHEHGLNGLYGIACLNHQLSDWKMSALPLELPPESPKLSAAVVLGKL